MDEAGPFRLDGRTAAVVGAASGIGEAVALACARAGARVACLDLEEGRAAEVSGRIRGAGGQADSSRLDIRDRAAVDACFEAIRERHGRLDVAVCTPSINVRKPLLSYTSEDFENVVELNLRGNFNVLCA